MTTEPLPQRNPNAPLLLGIDAMLRVGPADPDDEMRFDILGCGEYLDNNDRLELIEWLTKYTTPHQS